MKLVHAPQEKKTMSDEMLEIHEVHQSHKLVCMINEHISQLKEVV